jgi:hypothetical protein
MRSCIPLRLLCSVAAILLSFALEQCVADVVEYQIQNNCQQCSLATPTLKATQGILRLNWSPRLTVDSTDCECSWAIGHHLNTTKLAYLRIIHSMNECADRNTTLRVLCMVRVDDAGAHGDVEVVPKFVSVFDDDPNLCGFRDSGAVDVSSHNFQSCFVEFKRVGVDSPFKTRDGFELHWALNTNDKLSSPLHKLAMQSVVRSSGFISPITFSFVGTLIICGVYVIFGWKSHAQLNRAYIEAETRRRDLDMSTPGAAVVNHGGVRPLNTTSTIGAALETLAQRSRVRSRLESGAYATPVTRGSMTNMNLDVDGVPNAVIAPFRARRAERLSIGEQEGLRRVLDGDTGGGVGGDSRSHSPPSPSPAKSGDGSAEQSEPSESHTSHERTQSVSEDVETERSQERSTSQSSTQAPSSEDGNGRVKSGGDVAGAGRESPTPQPQDEQPT